MPLTNKQLIVFMKTPRPGKCKTRLIPFLSAEQACEFYQALVINCFEKIKTLRDFNIALYIYPDMHHPFIEKLKQNYPVSLHKQSGNNLGERMYHAMQTSLKHYQQCVLIGTDCPSLDADYINKAFKALDHYDMVFGPAEDGGYVLTGASRIDSKLFNNIAWGTNTVLQSSLKNNSAAQYRTHLLQSLWDIDTPEDYTRYQAQLNNV